MGTNRPTDQPTDQPNDRRTKRGVESLARDLKKAKNKKPDEHYLKTECQDHSIHSQYVLNSTVHVWSKKFCSSTNYFPRIKKIVHQKVE